MDFPQSSRRALLASLIAVVMLAASLNFVDASDADATPHPEHTQRNRGNGPADEANGKRRGNPNGNNGTIKIDGIEFDGTYDGHPNNEPHIDCRFQVDFYGFDSEANGDVAELQFRRWNPSGGKGPLIATAEAADEVEGLAPISYSEGGTVIVPLDDDGAGGGVDIDRQVLIELALPDTDPGAGNHHGHHVRLDAQVTSDSRTYKKTKVFWVTACPIPTPTPTPVPPTPVPPAPAFSCSVTGLTVTWTEVPGATYDILLNGAFEETLPAGTLTYNASAAGVEVTIEAVWLDGTVLTDTCITTPGD